MVSSSKKKSPLSPPLSKKGNSALQLGDIESENATAIELSEGEQCEPTKSPLKRGTAKPGGSLASDFNERHLIFNGRHLPYNPNNSDKARSLRKNMTPEEARFWHGFLRRHPLRFLRQKPIDHFILDFYCAKLRLGIEIDGSQHFSEAGIIYDKNRTDILSTFGVTILRFSNKDVNKNFEEVCQRTQQMIDSLVHAAKTA